VEEGDQRRKITAIKKPSRDSYSVLQIWTRVVQWANATPYTTADNRYMMKRKVFGSKGKSKG
jgi:hypothetical protein